MILCRDSADEPCPQIPRDSFRGKGLDDALEVGEDEDAEGGQRGVSGAIPGGTAALRP